MKLIDAENMEALASEIIRAALQLRHMARKLQVSMWDEMEKRVRQEETDLFGEFQPSRRSKT